MQKIAFLQKAFDEMKFWAVEDRKVLAKIFEIISDIQRNPFSGLGKPEPLKHKFKVKANY
ncbi:MAG: type II toxin-antitoxin system YoeB family toxin [Pyrinomonadaceae bacterium]